MTIAVGCISYREALDAFYMFKSLYGYMIDKINSSLMQFELKDGVIIRFISMNDPVKLKGLCCDSYIRYPGNARTLLEMIYGERAIP